MNQRQSRCNWPRPSWIINYHIGPSLHITPAWYNIWKSFRQFLITLQQVNTQNLKTVCLDPQVQIKGGPIIVRHRYSLGRGKICPRTVTMVLPETSFHRSIIFIWPRLTPFVNGETAIILCDKVKTISPQCILVTILWLSWLLLYCLHC